MPHSLDGERRHIASRSPLLFWCSSVLAYVVAVDPVSFDVDLGFEEDVLIIFTGQHFDGRGYVLFSSCSFFRVDEKRANRFVSNRFRITFDRSSCIASTALALRSFGQSFTNRVFDA